MADYTPAQGKYLSFIVAYIDKYGEAPAESDIAEAVQVSAPSVNAMVRKLESLGWITREKGVARSIDIPNPIPDLPKWRGRMPKRTVSFYAFNSATPAQLREIANNIRPERPRSVPKARTFKVPDGKVYQLKITLLRTKPAIWRRIETPSLTLASLHDIIQAAMGWHDAHMHEFQVGDRRFTQSSSDSPIGYFDDDDAEDENDITLAELHAKKIKKFLYWYDFGDDWRHEIVIEKVLAAKENVAYPIFTAGEKACPPEDCGGVYGFQEMLGGDQAMLEELDIEFDPDDFDKDAATSAMHLRHA